MQGAYAEGLLNARGIDHAADHVRGALLRCSACCRSTTCSKAPESACIDCSRAESVGVNSRRLKSDVVARFWIAFATSAVAIAASRAALLRISASLNSSRSRLRAGSSMRSSKVVLGSPDTRGNRIELASHDFRMVGSSASVLRLPSRDSDEMDGGPPA